jgi:uncharacterized protein
MLLVEAVVLVLAGMAAGFINVIAGGGSLISIPALMWAGLDGAAANGTNRIGVFIQSLSSTIRFAKTESHRRKESCLLALALLPGGIIGAYWGTLVEGVWFNRLLALVMLFVLLTMDLETRSVKARDDALDQTRLKNPVIVYSLITLIGFYGGLIHIGIGLMIMAVLSGPGGLDLKYTNMHKMIMIMPFTLSAIIIFSLYHEIAWLAGLMLAVGAAVGSWLGAKITVEKSEKKIRGLFKICIGAMIVKLMFFMTI